MILFAGFTGGDGQFFNAGQATVGRGDPSACGLAAPEREKIQARNSKVFPTPGYVNADDVNLSSGELGKTGDHVEKMFEATDIARGSVVLPAVNVNKKQRTFRFMDDFESRFSLRIIQRRALIAELDEGHFVAPILGTSDGVVWFSGCVGMVRSIRSARSQQHGQCECNEDRTRRAAIRIRVCFHWGVFRSATEVPHEHSVGIQARMVDLGIRETNWTLVPYGSATRSPSRRPQHSIGDAMLIGMRLRS